ncbi:uncharacterized protein LOC143351868 isoform X1 [Colletes latitarsis]|uniref:uncharacterized protein LOC143351868 isoform X1 n=1 Tax=Colletes latitarsis TaxID=2605962 RepID=UPI004036D387
MYPDVQKMGRKHSGLILTLAELCLLLALTVQNVHAYPYPSSQKGEDSGRSFLQTSNDFDEWSANDDRSNSRVRRNASDASSKPLTRSFLGSSLQEMQSDGKIVFPGEINQVPVCKGTTYCEKLNSYPEELVTTAIRRNETLKYLAGVDVLSDVEQRIDSVDDAPLCISTEQVIFPQSAENKDSQWKYIANQDNFKQGVRIEKCSKENVSCNLIGNLAEGYKTNCKQKYVYRQLAAVLSDGSIVPDRFIFPSSCCCHILFTANPYIRMGLISGEPKRNVTPIKTRRRK